MKLTRISPRIPALLASTLLAVAIAGCNVVPSAQDDPTRYFVLSDSAAASTPAVPASTAARIGLHSVRLETYLKHREIVVRTGANEIQFKDYRRWAEPLEAAVGRVLRENLVASSSISQVLTEPFPFDQQRDYDVSVEVRRCEGAAEGSGYKAEFSALIEVSTTGSDPKIVVRKLYTAPAADWDGSNYDRLANLLTADVSALAQEVASSIPPKG